MYILRVDTTFQLKRILHTPYIIIYYSFIYLSYNLLNLLDTIFIYLYIPKMLNFIIIRILN